MQSHAHGEQYWQRGSSAPHRSASGAFGSTPPSYTDAVRGTTSAANYYGPPTQLYRSHRASSSSTATTMDDIVICRFVYTSLRSAFRVHVNLADYIEALCRAHPHFDPKGKQLVSMYTAQTPSFYNDNVRPFLMATQVNGAFNYLVYKTQNTVDGHTLSRSASLLHAIVQALSLPYIKLLAIQGATTLVVNKLQEQLGNINFGARKDIANKLQGKGLIQPSEIDDLIGPLASLFNIIIVVMTFVDGIRNETTKEPKLIRLVFGASREEVHDIMNESRKVVFLFKDSQSYLHTVMWMKDGSTLFKPNHVNNAEKRTLQAQLSQGEGFVTTEAVTRRIASVAGSETLEQVHMSLHSFADVVLYRDCDQYGI